MLIKILTLRNNENNTPKSFFDPIFSAEIILYLFYFFRGVAGFAFLSPPKKFFLRANFSF